MGLRSIESNLAAELCYEAVTNVVRDYLDESREVGRYLYYYDNLVVPILRCGYQPPGLLNQSAQWRRNATKCNTLQQKSS
jgi:hypothetical protein